MGGGGGTCLSGGGGGGAGAPGEGGGGAGEPPPPAGTYPTNRETDNSIAFGSARRREADSQPISQLGRPAVSQTETHSWGFVSGILGSKQ